jgi:hypothetical protein
VWDQLLRLLDQARELAPSAEIRAEADAIREARSLLAAIDPVRPLLDRTVELLRKALHAKVQAFNTVFDECERRLQEDVDWSRLTQAQQETLVEAHHLERPEPVDLSSPEQLQDSLDDCTLRHWLDRTQALTARFEAARLAAVQLLKPNVVQVVLPKRTLNNDAELRAWLSEVERLVSQKLQLGPVAL